MIVLSSWTNFLLFQYFNIFNFIIFLTGGGTWGTWQEVPSCTSPPPQVGGTWGTWRNIECKKCWRSSSSKKNWVDSCWDLSYWFRFILQIKYNMHTSNDIGPCTDEQRKILDLTSFFLNSKQSKFSILTCSLIQLKIKWLRVRLIWNVEPQKVGSYSKQIKLEIK